MRWIWVGAAVGLAGCDALVDDVPPNRYGGISVSAGPVRQTAVRVKEVLVEVKNGSGRYWQTVYVDCAFRDRRGALVDSATTLVTNLTPGDVASGAAYSAAPSAASVVCRVSGAR